MNTRKARLIRAGILAARDPELAQYAHLGHRLVREAARREAANIFHRNIIKEIKAEQAERIRRHRA